MADGDVEPGNAGNDRRYGINGASASDWSAAENAATTLASVRLPPCRMSDAMVAMMTMMSAIRPLIVADQRSCWMMYEMIRTSRGSKSVQSCDRVAGVIVPAFLRFPFSKTWTFGTSHKYRL